MKNFKLIGGINLGILFVYNVLVRLAITRGDNHGLGIMIILCFLIIIQVVANGITAIVYYGIKNNGMGNSYMLSAASVAIIGFAACTMIH
jgi:hypothetical protein